MTKDMIERLRDGYVSRAKRWSGDTHSGIEGGEVDVAATEDLMKAAADELESSAKREAALVARVAELEELLRVTRVALLDCNEVVMDREEGRDVLQAKLDAMTRQCLATEKDAARYHWCMEHDDQYGYNFKRAYNSWDGQHSFQDFVDKMMKGAKP